MASKNRKFLTGSERAEFEHVYGRLPDDPQDPRFVLVSPELADAIDEFDAGVPPTMAQLGPKVEDYRERMNADSDAVSGGEIKGDLRGSVDQPEKEAPKSAKSSQKRDSGGASAEGSSKKEDSK